MSEVDSLFARCRAERRAALIGYLPAGYPSVEASARLCAALVDAGADLVEVGLPYSDPVLDGPTIQAAADAALRAGTRIRDVLAVVERVASGGGRAVVMTYYNPVLRYGVQPFARDLAAAGGLGLITPDLVPEEADEFIAFDLIAGMKRVGNAMILPALFELAWIFQMCEGAKPFTALLTALAVWALEEKIRKRGN